MSGGVDSSVTAYVLKQAGYSVIGVHMRNWDSADELGEEVCPQTEDLKYAQRVCDQLDIPLRQVDLVEAYWNNVFSPFLDAYSEGVTPNPDVWCNREIKFGRFHEYCVSTLGADLVATGHYCQSVRRQRPGAPVHLARGLDPIKDQSYFLCLVPRMALERALFPVGSLHKNQVREIAEGAGLATASRRDSYGICFIGRRNLSEFLPNYIPVTRGEFRNIDNDEVKGHHHGAELYTIGQNARLGGMSRRWFVVGTDVSSGVVYVANSSTHPSLYRDFVETPFAEFNWIDEDAAAAAEHGFRCKYRIRYRQDEMGWCWVQRHGDKLRVAFDLAQRAATPGQAVALYSGKALEDESDGAVPVLANGPLALPDVLPTATLGEICLGGGIIDTLGPSYAELGRDTPAADARLN